MTDNNEEPAADKPKITDRMQYLIGTLISVVIVVAYFVLTGEGG